jgi:hypothetical protein
MSFFRVVGDEVDGELVREVYCRDIADRMTCASYARVSGGPFGSSENPFPGGGGGGSPRSREYCWTTTRTTLSRTTSSPARILPHTPFHPIHPHGAAAHTLLSRQTTRRSVQQCTSWARRAARAADLGVDARPRGSAVRTLAYALVVWSEMNIIAPLLEQLRSFRDRWWGMFVWCGGWKIGLAWRMFLMRRLLVRRCRGWIIMDALRQRSSESIK